MLRSFANKVTPMIRSWVTLTAIIASVPVMCLAEELPAPKQRTADVPAPSAPQLPALQLPLPDIGDPSQSGETKPRDLKPTAQSQVVAPRTLLPNIEPPQANSPLEPEPNATAPNVTAPSVTLPNSAFPQPAPNRVAPSNPNPNGTTPPLPTLNSAAPATVLNKALPNNNVPNELKWRYKWHNGQWWYWSPDERWMIWERNSWSIYDPATYQPPSGFAKPGPRVVVTRQATPALPENYSGTEVSTPESTYMQPTPYAFGADSYFGPNGPAASYYNRGSATGLTFGGSAYSPIYRGYFSPQYISPRYTAPVYGYPGIGIQRYFGGRGVTIGFGF
jgi:hypothetical protein